jgi:hypothetical protein
MDPLARYTERLLEVERDFALYPDHVLVVARWRVKRTVEQRVPLAQLGRETERFYVRYRFYRYAGWTLALGALVFAAFYYEADGGPIGALGYVALAVAALGLLGLMLTFPLRRIEFVRFTSKSGRGGLDLGRAGNDAETFQAFVRAIQDQLRRL